MHYLGIYKHQTSVSSAELKATFTCIQHYFPRFFPIYIEVGPKKRIEFQNSDEFHLSKLPDNYWIDKNELVRIKILSVDSPFIVTALLNSTPGVIPSNILVKWDHQADIPHTTTLIDFLCEMADNLNADYAFVTDEETRYDDDISNRFHKVNPTTTPFGMFWITWFGKEQVYTLGEKIKRLEKEGYLIKKSKLGWLVVLKEEIYNEGKDKNIRLKAERLLNMDEL